jgi:hypothetical protein
MSCPGAGDVQLRIVGDDGCDRGKPFVGTNVIYSSKNTTVAVADESLRADNNGKKS